MDQKILEKRMQKNRFQAFLQHCMKTAIVTAAVIVAVVLVWKVVKPFAERDQAETVEAQETETAEAVKMMSPEAEDGSGMVGTKSLNDGMRADYEVPGWQKDVNGWWYAATTDSCYYNGWMEIEGSKYHFDANGYMNRGGWYPIGGQGCWFDANGVYDPTKDNTHMLALTFDDGPSEYTPALLDILEEHHASASFFMLGEMVEKYGADTIPRMAQLGCLIGNHSYDHVQLLGLDAATVESEFNRTDGQIALYNNGNIAEAIRFPYGDYTKDQTIVTGRPQIYWDLDSFDWDSRNVDAIVNTIMQDVEGGNILLFHDIYPETIEAVRILVPQLQSMGYELVNARTMAAARGYELIPGNTYFSFKDYNIERGTVTD